MASAKALHVASNWVNTLMAPGLVMQHSSGRPQPRTFPVVDPLPDKSSPRSDVARYTWHDIEHLTLSAKESHIATDSLSYTMALLDDNSVTFGTQLRKLSQLQPPPTRPATETELLRAMASIHYVTKEYMGRVACLEVTIAAFVANARMGRRAGLSFGACVDPVAFHAWLTTTDGKPVRLASDEAVEGVHYTLLRHS